MATKKVKPTTKTEIAAMYKRAEDVLREKIRQGVRDLNEIGRDIPELEAVGLIGLVTAWNNVRFEGMPEAVIKEAPAWIEVEPGAYVRSPAAKRHDARIGARKPAR